MTRTKHSGPGAGQLDSRYVKQEDWFVLPPVEDTYDPTGGLPADPEVGDRYISDATAGGWTIDYIYEWDGEGWLESTPEEGWMVWMLLDLVFWVFFSGGWMEVGDDTYLKLDASNDPITGDLLVKPTVDSLTGLVVQDKDANPVLTVDTINNRVGIGTTAPTYNLDVSGATTTQLHLSGTGSGADNGLYLLSNGAANIWYSAGASYNGSNWIAKSTNYVIYGGYSGLLQFYTGTGTTAGNSFAPSLRMGIGSAGGVTITGGSDTQQLIVKGNATQTTNLTEWQNSSGTVLANIRGDGNWGVGVGATANSKLRVRYLQTAATTTDTNGMELICYAYTTGFINATLTGATFVATTDPDVVGNVSGLIATLASVNHLSSATITYATGTLASVSASAGPITTARGFDAWVRKSGSGTITNAYGVYVRDVNTASTLNYAIYTNAGLNRLGDQLSIIGSADRIQSIVKGHSTQTANLQEWQDSSAGVLASIDKSGNITSPLGDIGFPYGSFSDSTTQTFTSTTTAYPITFNTDEVKSLVTHSTSTNPSRIYVDVAGTYLISYSACASSPAGNGHVNFWLRKNNSDIARTNTTCELNELQQIVITVTYLITLAANDYIELVANSQDVASCTINATGVQTTPDVPASPSIILTINKISK